ncbi:prolow-density lipoprotein receptor-related protein 1-like isoform X1 [Phymastichus coffea]|uniref:prolow-density lipoprotein receptor-related protein 1-like isoform X1 n=1 Tax=Phymastichus coffea TaxID=108790 RepID=UPI00273BA8F6|nr:prolow-density lipoprotein receptor-related protein 1-like isoform X1 [Phymastichus coffea]
MTMGSMLFVVVAALAAILVPGHARTIRSSDTATLYYLRDHKLYRLEPGSADEQLLEHDVADFELDADGQPLWMDRAARIHRLRGELVLRYEPSVCTARFAWDHLTDKFYVVDGDSQEIDVLQPGDKRAVLFERSPIREEHVIREKPKMLALDPGNGLMFILTDLSGIKNVYRSDMDGTGKRLLVEDVSSEQLSVDAPRRKVYWLNSRRRIVESVDFEGVERRPIDGLEGVTNETAIAVLDAEIHWSAGAGLINVCRLRDNSCDSGTLRRLKLPPSIHPIKKLKLPGVRTPGSGAACRPPSNGQCQHMCLLNSRGDSGCVCYVGWEPNGRECKPRRPRRQAWDLYMTPQPTLRPEPQPSDVAGGLPAHILIIGK